MKNGKNSHNGLKISMLITATVLIGFVAQYSPSDGAALGQTISEWEASAEAKELRNPVKADAESVKIGKKLFQNNCAICHGENGAGDGPLSANLDPKPGTLSKKTLGDETDGELFWKITNGKLPMPVFEQSISEKDRWHIVNYIRTL